MARRAPTDEAREAARVARAARVTRPTTRPGSERTDLAIGDLVRCQRDAPSKGTWPRYDGRKGTVVTLNRQRFPSGVTYGEIGVVFSWSPMTAEQLYSASAEVWFRADELVLVARSADLSRPARREGTE